MLHKSSPFLLRLAPGTLQVLTFEPCSPGMPHHPPHAGLTGLTRLELIGVTDSIAGGMPAESLGSARAPAG